MPRLSGARPSDPVWGCRFAQETIPACVTLLLVSAWAADPQFAGGERPGQVAVTPVTRLASEIGGAWTSGNTNNYALNGGLAGSHLWRRNKLSLVLAANVGRGLIDTDLDGHLSAAERAAPWIETARKYGAEARYDRFFGAMDSLYLLVGTLVDPFSGYDNRSHAQAGWSRMLLEKPRAYSLIGELGVDVAREDFVEGVDPPLQQVYAGRLMLGASYEFNPSVSISERIEVYENILDLDDVRILNTAALTATLGARVSLRLSDSLTWDNVPVEGFQSFDQTTMVTFVASIL